MLFLVLVGPQKKNKFHFLEKLDQKTVLKNGQISQLTMMILPSLTLGHPIKNQKILKNLMLLPSQNLEILCPLSHRSNKKSQLSVEPVSKLSSTKL